MSNIIDIEKLHKSFSEANQDDTPFAVTTPSGSVVNGDPAKYGSTSPKDYTLEFYLPVQGEVPAGAELVMGGSAYRQLVTAKQKFISQRIGRKIRSYASTVAIAFTKFHGDGNSNIFTVEDLVEVYAHFDDDVIHAFESIVSEVLGISPHLMEYITDTSLIENAAKIMENNPGFFQAD